jgi:hypothetical protein
MKQRKKDVVHLITQITIMDFRPAVVKMSTIHHRKLSNQLKLAAKQYVAVVR